MDSRQGLPRQKLRSAPVAPGDPALYRGSVVGSSHPGESEGVVQSRGLYGGRAALVSSHGSGPRRSGRTTDHVNDKWLLNSEHLNNFWGIVHCSLFNSHLSSEG